MPLIEDSTYHPPFRFRNAHVNTLYPAILRRVKDIEYQRIRIETPDNDFLDLHSSTFTTH